ncbi:hypothetical protein [Streptomyces sp. NPDC047453]|uniref:hypothetical protein n=1 Tax=Streptomyces sp. NPDC047453 TaxID=3154812 RepID=UPI0033C5C836
MNAKTDKRLRWPVRCLRGSLESDEWHYLGGLVDLDILYARENALARAFPHGMINSFSQMWAWGAQQHLAGAYKSEIAENAVSFLIGVRQIESLAESGSVTPGTWFHYSGPARFDWNKDRRTGSVEIVHPRLGVTLRASLRADSMLTTTSWVNLKGYVENTFLLGRVEASGGFDAYAVGHKNLFPELVDSSSGFRMTGHLIRAGFPEVEFGNLTAFVERLITVYEDALRLCRGWSLVGAGGAVDERSCQVLFDIIARHAVEQILVDRETETGLGPVDFTVSGLGERHGIEFKVYRGDLSGVERGLKVQLPTYMKSKKLGRGWLLVILSGAAGPNSDVVELEAKLRTLNTDDTIEVRVLDARPQISASRRAEAI